MLSLAVIWNSAYEYSEEITNDVDSRVKIIEEFEIDLGIYYRNFVYDIYKNEQKYKVDKKYNSMIPFSNKKVKVIIFEFSSERIYFHPQKNKNVYADLNDLKVYIRDKYSKKIDNYYFDNVFHCTDDLDEYKEDYYIIKKYLTLIDNSSKMIYEESVHVKRKNK